jgi:hypothetical protein
LNDLQDVKVELRCVPCGEQLGGYFYVITVPALKD